MLEGVLDGVGEKEGVGGMGPQIASANRSLSCVIAVTCVS